MAQNVITGVFKSRFAAETAVNRLVTAGFSNRDISVLMSDSTRGKEFNVETKSKMAQGAALGGTTGGALGAIAAGLAAVGALAIPGVGILAAGWIVAALAGAAAGGAAGGLVGGLIGLGVPEHEATLYANQIKAGSILVGVQTDDSDQADTARSILKEAAAETVTTG